MGTLLRPIDEPLLERLLEVARCEAEAAEVTPPLTPGDQWTPEREAWFRAHHHAARAGISGPAQEATWAVMIGEDPVGAVRLRRLSPDACETGIWLARSQRGRGTGPRVIREVILIARESGARCLLAETGQENLAMQAVLRRCGFELSRPTPDGRVRAAAVLGIAPPSREGGDEAR